MQLGNRFLEVTVVAILIGQEKICCRCFQRWISDMKFFSQEVLDLGFEIGPPVIDVVLVLIHHREGQGLLDPEPIMVAELQCGGVCVDGFLRIPYVCRCCQD